MTRHAKEALHAYVLTRKQKQVPREPWTPADKTDAFVALCCAVGFVFLVVL